MADQTANFQKNLTDTEIYDIVKAMDRVAKSLNQRFDGDDKPICDLMDKLGIAQNIANKLLITGEVLREACARGIHIPRSN